MPTPFSGLRVARSYLTPTDATILTSELDFQLAVNGGIEIFAVHGVVHLANDGGAVVSPMTGASFSQTLHMETDALEDVPISGGDDEVNVDTEVFFEQGGQVQQFEDETNGAGGLTLFYTPTNLFTFPMPLISARNITHRVEGVANLVLNCGLYVYYRYVRLTQAEMGFFLSRRI